MKVEQAFNDYQRVVNAAPEDLVEARRRRDFFKDALLTEPDIDEVIPSGSLARGTHKDPIHDVDVIAVFDETQQPAWGMAGSSSEEALSYVGSRVNSLLGVTNGSFSREVRLASPRNHAVKCFLDDPSDPTPFTVDVMPAFRRDGMLLIPEVTSRKWVPADPEHLINATAAAHAEWNKFAAMVRVLKTWAAGLDFKVKSLVLEVLALHNMPRSGDRQAALAHFFTSAAYYAEQNEIEDPAGVCGPIQRDLDTDSLAERLNVAASLAHQALAAQSRGDDSQAVAIWGQVFGEDFPAPVGGGLGGIVPGSTGPALILAPTLITPRPVKDAPQG